MITKLFPQIAIFLFMIFIIYGRWIIDYLTCHIKPKDLTFFLKDRNWVSVYQLRDRMSMRNNKYLTSRRLKKWLASLERKKMVETKPIAKDRPHLSDALYYRSTATDEQIEKATSDFIHSMKRSVGIKE